MLNWLFVGAAVALGIAAEANGVFMLVSPTGWYFAVPGVTTTGPFNQHFIRDIGLIFVLLGACFVGGAVQRRYRLVLWAAPTVWLAGHAFFHVWEVAAGICGPSVLVRDFPAVSFPALIGMVLSLWAARDARNLTREQERRVPFATAQRNNPGELRA